MELPALVLIGVFGTVALLRYLEYKETVELARQGLVKPRPAGDGRGALRWGILFAAVGLALCAGLYPFGALVAQNSDLAFPLGFGPWMLFGLVPLFTGLALVLIYLVAAPNGRQAPGALPMEAETARQPGSRLGDTVGVVVPAVGDVEDEGSTSAGAAQAS